ncbi:alkylated DNA repair protein AlkB [Corynebacterium glutamicum MB001]|uniref:Alkylated DNA repair protein n=1 Tax=Corynebacterium glutamicum (strain ATCC 13032 / DSM 20300 / JCM 1318 / BCRC 11384 / CCUG 27702 / LMG 3730 / NBRC 12168 / NCIMB 10025 / NRRL B-2784 / 534) TaxID=196627 RepID=Q8NU07_CORGL|nr:alpha-ketoglutarate-dependent dioxygenase AlkB [Corynebacterium glutamicum]AGT04154.1 alkylated DNA repair protein AlkB [Corynebacterium glutamicum MB001]ARV65598.1 alpha-ketoglutarate-dependent dioxygenase AlkB [Corynebacterium glutamicum]ASW12934.1 alkylated DNA repair protein AlkB [Corynebacterium glutamicum]AUH99774.1 alpha-ketoglutarate-dependent dioxygenase AlkB [Corynebacterium glutamicum]AUI03412.1 alpha-ketoglutarate-dependent dioxygenase AlkB [Corynebacterium glutamicum]
MPTLFDDPLHQLPRPPRRVAAGVVHLPNFLGLAEQKALVAQARDLAREVVGTPLAMVRPKLKSGQMSVHMLHLGKYWASNPYRYVDVVDGFPVPPLPDSFVDLAHRALLSAGSLSNSLQSWSEAYRAEAALVNYYSPDASMGMHQDANEESEAPVISLSIGDTGIFRLGGTLNRNKPWTDIPLMSGDLIVFGGANRQAFHGIPSIEANTAPAGCGLKEGRINITIRQLAL